MVLHNAVRSPSNWGGGVPRDAVTDSGSGTEVKSPGLTPNRKNKPTLGRVSRFNGVKNLQNGELRNYYLPIVSIARWQQLLGQT